MNIKDLTWEYTEANKIIVDFMNRFSKHLIKGYKNTGRKQAVKQILKLIKKEISNYKDYETN